MTIIQQIIENLYSGQNPYLTVDLKYVDKGYPHTNIKSELLEILFQINKPSFILECGSMVGGSAIIMAQTLLKIKIDACIICIDPFTGDVNMWDWEKNATWKFLNLENGIPTIYKRFLANCKEANLDNIIFPINCTTSVGTKLLARLYDQKRITEFPNYIYLDSAHEPDETYIELKNCWKLLKNNGILFGDDWNWIGVREDVIKFAEFNKHTIDTDILNSVFKTTKDSQIYNGSIFLYKNQWVLFKNSTTVK